MREVRGFMRKEIKFYISKEKAFLLYQMLKVFCQRDPHGDYDVKSLYFDRYDYKAMQEKIDGLDRIGKIRIRQYNSEKKYKLEHKYKKGDYVIKSSYEIDHARYLNIVSNPNLIHTYFPRFIELKARKVITYHRKVLIYRDVRFTFDEDIKASLTKATLHEPYLSRPITEDLIFEVKYTHGLPIHLKKILMDCGIEMSISKYALTNTGVS